jgi:hypothetical protein
MGCMHALLLAARVDLCGYGFRALIYVDLSRVYIRCSAVDACLRADPFRCCRCMYPGEKERDLIMLSYSNRLSCCLLLRYSYKAVDIFFALWT